jgi:hypothetical protein
MKMPPFLLKVKIKDLDHSFSIWLPLFIIGPILLILALALLLIALPFILISFLFTWESDCWRWVGKLPALGDVVTSLPGLKIDVEDNDRHVTVIFR